MMAAPSEGRTWEAYAGERLLTVIEMTSKGNSINDF
jgi:hypothetical protein